MVKFITKYGGYFSWSSMFSVKNVTKRTKEIIFEQKTLANVHVEHEKAGTRAADMALAGGSASETSP